MDNNKRVVKSFEPRMGDILKLESMLEYGSITKQQRKLIESEIRMIKAGDAAEKNASYLIGEFINTGKSFVLNNLRLEFDGSVCQVDHLTLNSYGIVRLFETKSFSTGIKIDEDGVFWRWDGYNKRYVEIPSPIKQSERHEPLLRRVLASIGYKTLTFQHFVIVDYKAKLIKPKKGFENVCRPDMIDDAVEAASEKIGTLDLLKFTKRLVVKAMSDDECRDKAIMLASMHKPIEINYEAKFGLNPTQGSADVQPDRQTDAPIPEAKKVASSNIVADTKEDKLTGSKMAAKFGIKTKAFEEKLLVLDYFEMRGERYYLTDKGKQAGIEFRKGRYNYFFLYPMSLEQEIRRLDKDESKECVQ